MKLFNTALGQKTPLPNADTVTLYVCGITPYASAHLGHALTYITFDVLARRLRDAGKTVIYVRNVTDIDDPLFARARATDESWKALGDRELASFTQDMATLGLVPPTREVRVTDAISPIRDDIARLLEQGDAYVAGGNVYFATPHAPGFGDIGHLSRESMLQLAAARGGAVDDPNKRDPLDVVLWQQSAHDEPSWQAPWGNGRPGWHIECTAIINATIGRHVMIHGGGADLVFPHHECENALASSMGATALADIWMHVALLSYQGEKMSKSLGNLVFVRDLLWRYEQAEVRLSLLEHHYRQEWEWHDEALVQARNRLARWRSADGRERSGLVDAVRERLDDDLDAPGAIALIDEAASSGARVRDSAALLGIAI